MTARPDSPEAREARQERLALKLSAGAFLMAVLLCATVLTGCGGGGDDGEPDTCVVDGKPLPREQCK